jgi:hypothetical protein
VTEPPAVVKVVAFIPISHDLWEEGDRLRRPWLYPDRPLRIRRFDLFPRLTLWTDRATVVRRRVRAAWWVLHGDAVIDEDSLR